MDSNKLGLDLTDKLMNEYIDFLDQNKIDTVREAHDISMHSFTAFFILVYSVLMDGLEDYINCFNLNNEQKEEIISLERANIKHICEHLNKNLNELLESIRNEKDGDVKH